MKIEELNPFIRYAKSHPYYHAIKENTICYDCRVFYLVKGRGRVFVAEQWHDFAPNTAIFFPPRTAYRFEFASEEAFEFFIFNFDLTNEFCHLTRSFGVATKSTFDPFLAPNYTLPPEFSNIIIQRNGSAMFSHLEYCIGLFLRKDPYYRLLASASLKLALLQLLRARDGEKSDYRLVENVLEFIRGNYHNCELDNRAIAAQFSYHPYYLNELMRHHTGRTLHGQLIDYRLHMARHYLTTTNLSITAIAEKAGFSSYTYFIKLFRERVGTTPLQYRKRIAM